MRRRALLLGLPLLLTSSLLAQTHPNLERGLAVGKAYQVGDVDSVCQLAPENPPMFASGIPPLS